MDLHEYWKAIQEKICPACADGDGKGDCRLPAGEECALKSLLPQIDMTVANVHSSSYEAYVSALRRNVCILCEHQRIDLSCKKRDHLECALDKYYPEVVEIIKTVRAVMESTEAG